MSIALTPQSRKQSLGQGNVFRPVCHSVHREVGFPACIGRGGGSPACTEKGGRLPSMHWEGGLASQHELGRGVGFTACTGKGVGFPVCTGKGGWLPSMHWNTKKWMVCILLECFLVKPTCRTYFHKCSFSSKYVT